MEENKMGVMPIDKLIISMSLPIMISMLVQALYNIVDSIFVAMISENALTAVSMAFPIQNLMIAVGVGTAVGVNALLARSLGEKDTEKVNKVAENAVFLILVSYLLFLIIGLFFAEPFFRSQTDIEEIIVYGKQYLTICCCLSFGIFTQLMFERMLQATGKTIYTMYTQGVGAIINIALDPVLIFGLFGLPKMGISGAAAATVIGQMIAGILAGSVCMDIKKRYAMKQSSREAANSLQAYRADCAFHFSVTGDKLVNQFVRSIPIPRNTSGGSGRGHSGGSSSGRSTVHTSSSGRSHGGGGRRF